MAEYFAGGHLRFVNDEWRDDNVDAIEISRVRHGRWEVVVGSDGKEHMVCTVCRKQQDLTGVFSYCPNCGARMDGAADVAEVVRCRDCINYIGSMCFRCGLGHEVSVDADDFCSRGVTE